MLGRRRYHKRRRKRVADARRFEPVLAWSPGRERESGSNTGGGDSHGRDCCLDHGVESALAELLGRHDMEKVGSARQTRVRSTSDYLQRRAAPEAVTAWLGRRLRCGCAVASSITGALGTDSRATDFFCFRCCCFCRSSSRP